MTEIRWVGQEEPYGCGAAAIAMLTGRTYQEVVSELGDSWTEHGLHDPESLLADMGYALARRYRVMQYHGIVNEERTPWPPEPFGDVHICQVYVSKPMAHMVVMLRDGTVLDPVTPEPKRLADYLDVNWVAAVVRYTTP